MIPDLGKYAISVLSAYGSTFVILGILAIYVLRRNAQSKAALDVYETSKDD